MPKGGPNVPRAFRGRRSGAAYGWGNTRFEEGLLDDAHERSMELAESGEASWMNDAEAHLFGHVPNPAQQKLLDSVDEWGLTEIGYGGSVGGGKTTGVIFCMMRLFLRYPGWQHLWARKYEKGVEASALSSIRIAANWLEQVHGLKWSEVRFPTHTITFYTGPDESQWSRLTIMGLDNTEVVQGASFDGVSMDEAAQMGKEHYVAALKRRRPSMNRSFAMKQRGEVWRPPVLMWTANAASGYVFQEFVVRELKGQLGVAPYENRKFIFSAVTDNAEHLGADYVKSLMNSDLGSSKMESELRGEWDFTESLVYASFADGVFCQFDPEKVAGRKMHEIEFEGGYDYGWGHPCSWVVGFVHEGLLWITDEMVGPKIHLEEQAQFARRFGQDACWWADQSTRTMGFRNGARSVMEEFGEVGVFLRPANTGAQKREIALGVAALRSAFKRGVIRIDEQRCPRLKEAVTEWRFKIDRHGEPAPDDFQEAHKDPNDALRYLFINVEYKLRFSAVRLDAGGVMPAPVKQESDWLGDLVSKELRRSIEASSEAGTLSHQGGRY